MSFKSDTLCWLLIKAVDSYSNNSNKTRPTFGWNGTVIDSFLKSRGGVTADNSKSSMDYDLPNHFRIADAVTRLKQIYKEDPTIGTTPLAQPIIETLNKLKSHDPLNIASALSPLISNELYKEKPVRTVKGARNKKVFKP